MATPPLTALCGSALRRALADGTRTRAVPTRDDCLEAIGQHLAAGRDLEVDAWINVLQRCYYSSGMTVQWPDGCGADLLAVLRGNALRCALANAAVTAGLTESDYRPAWRQHVADGHKAEAAMLSDVMYPPSPSFDEDEDSSL